MYNRFLPKSEKGNEDWGNYQKLLEEIPEFSLIRRMLLRAVKGRNAAVLQYKQFVYVDESTRRRMSNAATPKPEKFEDEWAKLELGPTAMRGKADLQEAALIVTIVRPELAKTGKLLTRTAPAPFGCEEIVIRH